MVKKCARHNIGLRKIFTDDGGILLQLLFTAAVISAGIFLELNFLQWAIVGILSLSLLAMGLYRGAAKLLTLYDQSISLEQGIRIRAMGNILVAFTSGIAFFTYLIIFMPKINSLI
jgi:diacylglycerol kinase